MKNRFKFLPCFLAMFCFWACEMTEDPNGEETFEFVKDGKVVLDLSDIEYYDFSAHVIYLNESNPLGGDVSKLDGAVVKVDGEEIYSLRIQDPLSSTIFPGAQVNRSMDVYGDFAFRIGFVDWEGTIPDPRADTRIKNVLEREGKLREGLSVEIVSIEKNGTEVNTTLRLKNLDPVSYYHLDPDKMGVGLFHYFTNGLTYYNPATGYIQDTSIGESPDPWNYWTNDWLAEIGGMETKEWVFTYELGAVPQGQELDFFFDFPAPNLAITTRAALDIDGSRVWLGAIGGVRKVRF